MLTSRHHLSSVIPITVPRGLCSSDPVQLRGRPCWIPSSGRVTVVARAEVAGTVSCSPGSSVHRSTAISYGRVGGPNFEGSKISRSELTSDARGELTVDPQEASDHRNRF